MKRILCLILSVFTVLTAHGQERDTVNILFMGDVMMHARQLQYDYREFLEPVRHIISDADISVANMEFTLAGEPYTGYPAFSCPDGYADYVADCGVDIFLTANNHILDKGRSGLKRTLDVYDKMQDTKGIHYTGTAMGLSSWDDHNPLYVRWHGHRIAFINFTYGTNSHPNPGWPDVSLMEKDNLTDLLHQASSDEAQCVVALPHWGTEYILTHSKEQSDWAGWLADNGANLIVGEHPHVVQDTSHVAGVPVIYSMGNLVSNMSATNTRLGMMTRVRLIFGEIGLLEVCEPELIFTWCCLPGMLRNNYTVVAVDEWASRRSEWKQPSDYDNMMATYRRVLKTTGIDEKDNKAGSH